MIVAVVVGADGRAQAGRGLKSSGFDRLDQAARDSVLNCRYVPGKRTGVAQSTVYVRRRPSISYSTEILLE